MPRHMPPKAFNNAEFVNSRDGRVMRIMAEYLEPQKRLREAGIEDTIVFFGSARTLSRSDAQQALSTLCEKGDAPSEDILRAAGFTEGVGYHKQLSVNGSTGSRTRPDFVFPLPRGMSVRLSLIPI